MFRSLDFTDQGQSFGQSFVETSAVLLARCRADSERRDPIPGLRVSAQTSVLAKIAGRARFDKRGILRGNEKARRATGLKKTENCMGVYSLQGGTTPEERA